MKMNILRKGFAVGIMASILVMIVACVMIMIGLVPLSTGIVWYTMIHVSGSITNLYAILLGSAFLVLFLVFRLSAHLVEEATSLKEEALLTV